MPSNYDAVQGYHQQTNQQTRQQPEPAKPLRTLAQVRAQTTQDGLQGYTVVRQGHGGTVLSNVEAAEFLNLKYVAHYNRHSNTVTMASGFWFVLQEPEMKRFYQDLEEQHRAQSNG